ncbi:MAG: hypothetical protein LBI29_03785 [Rickettsiales bacterium]|jgi:outer membrane protein assembly factor BamE (lipoprotein component of BamABCDE complex)|nr:hypothetical protein [Rickettsiales bacterium]
MPIINKRNLWKEVVLVLVALLSLVGCTTPLQKQEPTYYRDSGSYRSKIWSLEGKNTKVDEVIALLGEPDRKEKFPETSGEDWFYWSQSEELWDKKYAKTKRSDYLFTIYVPEDRIVRSVSWFRIHSLERVKIADRTKESKIPLHLLNSYKLSESLRVSSSLKPRRDPSEPIEQPASWTQKLIKEAKRGGIIFLVLAITMKILL